MTDLTILQGDCREKLSELPDGSVNCCVTSPPYFGLRDYNVAGQIGLEQTPDEYVAQLVDVFRDVRRVLRDDATLWLNLGDSSAGSRGNYGRMNRSAGTQRIIRNGSQCHQRAYDGKDKWRPPTSGKLGPGLKEKDLIGIPWAVAFALRADGWWLRSEIIWHKPSARPESVEDRPTRSHEQIFLLSKKATYFYDHEAIKEPIAESTRNDSRLNREGYEAGRPERGFPGQASHGGGLLVAKQDPETRNKRSVWTVTSRPYKEAHFATYPPELIKPCILAGCPAGGVVLDPFAGSGTTGAVALGLGRSAILIELNPDYVKLIEKRCRVNLPLMFEEVTK